MFGRVPPMWAFGMQLDRVTGVDSHLGWRRPAIGAGLAKGKEQGRGASAGRIPQRPEPFGRFRLLERIGRGGMAEVFLAVPEGVPGAIPFVVKRIRPEKSDSPAFVRMFCEEARVGALLRHPNLVEIHDFGTIDGRYFLAMEYLHGRSVSAVLETLRRDGRAVEPATAAYIAREVARGLDHMHRQHDRDGRALGLVHRDVTPSNIMLLSSGGVKLLDFGIAKATAAPGRRVDETRAGILKGKVGYLPPERIRDQPFDARSDLFTLGVVLWEMLVGDRLYGGISEHETARLVLGNPAPPPSARRPEVPPALEAIVGRCLARRPADRWDSAAELGDALDTYLEGNLRGSSHIARLVAALDDVAARQAA
jgi:serine/threonine-protein kinase